MLKAHHMKALTLLRENAMSVKEIAKACNISTDHLYGLMEGAPDQGNAGVLFCQEYKKIMKECDKRTRKNVKTLVDRLVEDLIEWNESLPAAHLLELPQVKIKKEILSELVKVGAGVEIGEMHFHSGLTGGELVDEFKRLRSLVELAAKGGGVSSALRRRSGLLPVSDEGKSSRIKRKETPVLPPESETGDISPGS
jgi:hypothetical protein